jgi:hypothetical protein
MLNPVSIISCLSMSNFWLYIMVQQFLNLSLSFKWETQPCLCSNLFSEHLKKTRFVNNFCINYHCRTRWKDIKMDTHKFHYTVFIFVIQCSYMFQPYILAIFGELQILLTCTAHMTTCHRWLAVICDKLPHAMYAAQTCSSLKMAKMYGRNM